MTKRVGTACEGSDLWEWLLAMLLGVKCMNSDQSASMCFLVLALCLSSTVNRAQPGPSCRGSQEASTHGPRAGLLLHALDERFSTLTLGAHVSRCRASQEEHSHVTVRVVGCQVSENRTRLLMLSGAEGHCSNL